MTARTVVGAAAVLFLLACGTSAPPPVAAPDDSAPSTSAPPEETNPPAGECVRATCESLAMSCGSASDGCGGTLECGTCETPVTPEQPCIPKTCAAAGATCGTLSDGCGGTVSCGTCTEGQSCGGGGTNKCGAAACVPKTCASLGASCGSVSDGCGSVLACGTCGENQTCSAANKCEAKPTPAPTGGTPSFFITRADAESRHLVQLDADAQGRIFIGERRGEMGTATPPEASAIAAYQSSGTLIWRKSMQRDLSQLLVDPTATFLRVLSAFIPDPCEYQECGSSGIDRFDKATGTMLQSDWGGTWEAAAKNTYLTYRADGSFLKLGQTASAYFGSFHAPTNTYFEVHDFQEGIFDAAYDPAGKIITVGREPGTGLSVVTKWDVNGMKIWRKVLDVDGGFERVGVTAAGTIVVQGTFHGTLSFAGVAYTNPTSESRGFIAVYESNGQERLARGPLGAGSMNLSLTLAVDPVGRAYVTYIKDCTELVILKYGLDGNLLWRKPVAFSGCLGTHQSIVGTAVSNGGLVIGGHFRGALDFGSGPKTADGTDAFLLGLNP